MSKERKLLVLEQGTSSLKEVKIESKEIPLEVLQDLVNGYIEVAPYSIENGIVMVCNEEGRLRDDCKLSIVMTYTDSPRVSGIYGTTVLCRIEGDTIVGLTDKDIEICKDRLDFCFTTLRSDGEIRVRILEL